MDFLIHHMLEASALRQPGKEALVHDDQRLTYDQVTRQTASLAHGLRTAGVQRGDRLGIYLDASVPQVLSIFGTSAAGGVFVPINGVLFPDQVAHIAKDCRMKGLITSHAKLAPLLPILGTIPSLEFLVVTGLDDSPALSLRVLPFEDLCQSVAAEKPPPAEHQQGSRCDPLYVGLHG